MKINDPQLTAAALAKQLGGQLIGDGTIVITGANEIHHVQQGDVCFVDFHKYYDKTLASAASVILIDQEYACPAGKALIVTPRPFEAYDELVGQYRRQSPKNTATSSDFATCVSLKIGKNCSIAPGAQLGHYVTIGDNCTIYANAVIGDETIIGNNVTVQANSVIGSNSFYFKKTAQGYQPWNGGGRVILEDDVEIGPNCTIARGVSSDTVIGKGTKIDALVQIGHDCKIGAHCLFAAQVGIAGNVTVKDWTIMYGQVGIAQNVTIGERSVILAKSGVGKDLEGGKDYFGAPVQEARAAFQDLVNVRNMRKKK